MTPQNKIRDHSVSGRVVSTLRPGTGSLTVTLVDKGIGPGVELATGETDIDGAYRLTYSLTAIKRKSAPDIQVRVSIGTTFLGASVVRYNARPAETLDVLLPDKSAVHLPSEYETLTQALAVPYAGALRDLKENDAQQDITYLANKTGWDARAVTLAVLADQFSHSLQAFSKPNQAAPTTNAKTSAGTAKSRKPVTSRTDASTIASNSEAQATAGPAATPGLNPAFYYALFRAGVPVSDDALYSTPSSSVQSIWRQATAQGVIPHALEAQIPSALNTFQTLGASRRLDAKVVAGSGTLRQMLEMTLGDDAAALERFAQLQAAHGNDTNTFWTEVERTFDAPTAERLRFDGQLGFITLNNGSLIQRLHASEREQPLTSSLDLVYRGYYDTAKWVALVDETIPDVIPGANGAEKKTNYARMLAAQVQLSYPTAVVAERVNSGALPLTMDAKVRTGVYQFLTAQQGKFELGIQPVEQYIADSGMTDVDPAVVTQLKRLHRVYQVTPCDPAMNVLLRKGLDSAYAIVHYGQQAFEAEIGPAIDAEIAADRSAGDPDGAALARLTYAKAQSIYNSVLQVAVDYGSRRVSPRFGNGKDQYRGPFPSNGGGASADSSGNPGGDAGAGGNAGSGAGGQRGGAGSSSGAGTAPSVAASVLENLFGSMDYCSCDECRSIIGPAAYLVDLLNFTNVPSPPSGSANPQAVLLARRPDIEHLPLTCANTLIALPYIDPVLEILEWFTSHGSLAGFVGYSTPDDIDSAELLACPQNVDDNAYAVLQDNKALFPPPLPFSRPLELSRRLFQRFGVTLTEAMTTLRPTDALERSPGIAYGWRDILMEQLLISRAEHSLLTNSTLTLQQIYGYPATTSDADTIAELSDVLVFLRRLDLKADDLVAILRTRFINPCAPLIPALQNLGVTFQALGQLFDGTLTGAAFLALLPTGPLAPDPAAFGGDIVQWVQSNKEDIQDLIVLSNPSNPSDLCTLSDLRVRYANPSAAASTLVSADFVRLLRFIRLWRKLGLSIQQTDDILAALLPPTAKIVVGGSYVAAVTLSGTLDGTAWQFTTAPAGSLNDIAQGIAASISAAAIGYDASPDGATILLVGRGVSSGSAPAVAVAGAGSVTLTPDTAGFTRDLALLDKAFLVMLPRLGFAFGAMQSLGMTPSDDLREGLALWAPIGTYGRDSLYAAMFQNPASPLKDGAFDTDAGGQVLQDAAVRLMDHELALRGAFNLTGAEFALIARGQLASPPIATALNFDANTPLSLANVSEIYRRGLLARSLEISVLELLLLSQYSGLNPLTSIDPIGGTPAEPAVVRLVRLVQALSAAGLTPTQALYIFWNHDISGDSTPDSSVIRTLAHTLRSNFSAIDAQFVLKDDPTGSIAQQLLAGVYGAPSADFYFGLLNATFTVSVPYTGSDPSATVSASGGRLTYDAFAQVLTYAGYLDAATIGPLTTSAGANVSLTTALQALVTTAASGAAGTFFHQFPELLGAYDSFVNSGDPSLQSRRTNLLATLLPSLIVKRRQEQALADVAGSAGADLNYTATLLADPTVLHGAVDSAQPAVNDFTAVQSPGLSAQFFLTNDLTQPANISVDTTAGLTYDKQSPATTLPAASAGSVIAGVWSGYLTCPQDDLYRLSIDTDGASVDLQLDGAPIVFQKSGTVSTSAAVALKAGDLTPIRLTVTGLTSSLDVKWQAHNPGLGLQIIDPQFLFSATLLDKLRRTYIRFLKAVSLATTLSLTPSEIAHLGTQDSARVSTTDGRDKLPAGVNTFTPVSMVNIEAGTVLVLDSGALQETVTVTAVDATTFTATTVKAHDGTTTPFAIIAPSSPVLGHGWLNCLVVDGLADALTAPQLGAVLTEVLDFARLKAALSARDERFLDAWRDPTAQLSTGQNAVLALTGWSADSLNSLLQLFFGSTNMSALTVLANFVRTYDAFGLLRASGIAASTLISSTTNDPSAAEVSDLQSAVRALYAHADWLNTIKPINDAMRLAQRDALTAYVLQLLRNQTPPVVVDLDTPVDTRDKLFELLLVDVNMDCCMETSRIRLALSSTQLFIERSIRGLEINPLDASKNVAPECFPADQWGWRKRFRVWQANRKCFLYPASYLYEEFRDDQSPIFKTVMSKLLQSDITDDAATAAYVDYLMQLELIAKLEPCAMHVVPATSRTNETVHVVARTPGAKRTYYYRKFDGVSWSPWEEIKLGIDDTPVAFGVSDDRLLLFWLQVIRQPVPVPKPPAPAPATGGSTDGDAITTANIAGVVSSVMNSESSTGGAATPMIAIGVNLCWSEYHAGKWQAAKTSDTKHPCMLGTVWSDQLLTLGLGVYSDPDPSQRRLWIQVSGGPKAGAFLFYNTHSLPVVISSGFPIAALAPNPYWRGTRAQEMSAPAGSWQLIASYEFDDSSTFLWADDDIMASNTPINPTIAASVDPQFLPANQSASSWTTPFIYADVANAFYVTLSPAESRFRTPATFGVPAPPRVKFPHLPLMINKYPTEVGPPPPRDAAVTSSLSAAPATEAVARFVTEDAYIARGLAVTGTVPFNGRQIGPAGSVDE